MKKYLAWIPALVIMTAIFWFSAQPADVSTEMSDSVTRALLWTAEAVGLTDRLSPEQVHDLCGLLATPVRKAAHITEFAVFHLTVFIRPVPVGASLEEMAEGRPGGDRGLCLHR